MAALLFGTTGTAQALGPKVTTPLGVGTIRLVVGGFALLALLPLFGGRLGRAASLWRTGPGFVAGACTALYQVFFFAGVERAGVAVGTLVTIGSGPVFAGVLSAVVLSERPARSWIAATGICLVGLGLLSLGGRGSANFESVGVLLALGAGLAYAAYTVAARRILREGTPSLDVMASAFGLGGVLLLPLLFSQPMSWLPTVPGVALALYLGLVTTTVAYVFFGRGLAVLPAGPVTTLVLAEPLVATALGIGILGESLPAIGVVGAVAVLGGLALQGLTAVRGEVTSSKDAVRVAERRERATGRA